MECSEFIDVSEAYLSDELLAETNILVFRHLEDCRKCRENFAARRELRQRMSSSVRHSEEFRIDPVFANRLTAALKESALSEGPRGKFWVPRVQIPLIAGVLIVGILGLVVMDPSFKRTLRLFGLHSERLVIEGVAGILADAAGHHRSCALQKLRIWEKLAQTEPDIAPVYLETIVKPLHENVSARVKLLHVDDCIFEGKPFVHVILKDGDAVVSVFFAKSGDVPGELDGPDTSILSDDASGYQIAAFRKHAQTVLVVSDLSDVENLSFARTLMNAWNPA